MNHLISEFEKFSKVTNKIVEKMFLENVEKMLLSKFLFTFCVLFIVLITFQ